MIPNVVALDLETHLIQPGLLAPPHVVGSVADAGESRLVAPSTVAEFVRKAELIFGANFAFDMGVLTANDLLSIADAFRAYDEDKVFDVLIAESLNAIARGALGKDPRSFGPLRDPATGKVMDRFSLSICTDLVLGRKDAKANDLYRTRYALLEGLPQDEWPPEAVQYPKDDVRNTFDVGMAQLGQRTRPEGSAYPGDEAYRNLHDMSRQVRAAWSLHLAAMWGFRTDAARVAELEKRLVAEHAKNLTLFQSPGFIRADGSEDQAVVKRAAATAYGATGKCPRCGGTGKVPSEKTGKPVNCKVDPEAGTGCDGTGLDLSTALGLPRTEKGAVGTSRDALMESGDDLLEQYALVSEGDKLRGTYLPFLKRGTVFPINGRPNVLVETGRASYKDPTQTMPKAGGIRECIVARDGTALVSIDYSAIELCTLAQECLLQVGHSRMAELINESRDPGALHTAFAATMVGASFDDLKARVKAKDHTAMAYRQAAKAANFGFGGGMGASTFVLAKRKRIEGETKSPDGTVYAGLRFCILIGGATRCGTEKVTEWKGRQIAPCCKKCLECVEDLRRMWFKEWPEVSEYHGLVAQQVDTDGAIVSGSSGRVRGDVSFTEAANGHFQTRAADGAKLALYAVSRECYVPGAGPDGRDSPMYGARPIFFAHDEIVSEIPMGILSAAAKRMTTVMVENMRIVVPDVFVSAEPAAMYRLSKEAATVFDTQGNLIPDPGTY